MPTQEYMDEIKGGGEYVAIKGLSSERKKLQAHQTLVFTHTYTPVSYTHLDVYKRQVVYSLRVAICKG